MESLIYSDTRLGRLGKRPLTRPSTPDPVYGPSIVRHDRFLEPFKGFVNLSSHAIVSILPKRKYVRMHDQIGHKLPVVEIICTAPFIISILLKRMSLNPVSETIYDAQGPR
jgi:hypothetical protein